MVARDVKLFAQELELAIVLRERDRAMDRVI